MIDLQNLSIVTTVHIDSADRLSNVHLFIKYFETFFSNYEIIVVEQDSQSKIGAILKDRAGVFHRFIETENCHNRAWNLNAGARLSTRKYLMLNDIDCFVPPSALERALAKLDSGSDFVLPFNGVTIQIRASAFDDDTDFEKLVADLPYFPKLWEIRPPKHDPEKFEPLYGSALSDTAGGSMICNRRQFFIAGAFNENILSYGCEEGELYHRLNILGYKLDRMDNANLFHFEHVRTIGSTKNNFFESNRKELARVRAMSPDELRRYVNSGFRLLKLNPELDLVVANTATEFSISLIPHNRLSTSDECTVLVFDETLPEDVGQLEKFLDLIEQKYDNYSIFVLEGKVQKLRSVLARKYTQHRWLKRSMADRSDDEIRELIHTDRRRIGVFRVESPLDASQLVSKLDAQFAPPLCVAGV